MPEDQVPASPPPPPASFGDEMRKEREIRGISLKEIADATKISKRYLEAIEKDDYTTLPAPVFTRGFVREYARYLGLNADEAVNRYMHYRQSLEDAAQPARDARRAPTRDVAREPLREMRHETARESLRKIQSTPDEGEPKRSRLSRGVFAFIALLAFLVAAAWLIQNRSMFLRRSRPADRGTSNDTVARVLTPAATATETTPPAATRNNDLVMVVRANENSWVTLEADGRSVFNSELRQGEQQTFRAKERFTFQTIGNAGGLDITLNGSPMRSLGESGRVIRNRVVDRDTLAALDEVVTTTEGNRVTQEP